ncbi:MAG: acetolactate synthase small subunit [Dehalococcoidales bacterium]|jgi:acetolactate synthase-1/3 small subunit|nr:acetolactate synthase small subunit [Dehalococcoidales bacterium]MDD4230226.1 acetolactate synthase small subunit [Dehalococcoidales bacterium]MDD4465111.1 acetolactate synthase small subunit [Dehalococcoidales bacterium]MDD5401854.1 acetolactate synthase small subunit [Dehalococcoidales bacterium]
MATQKHTIVALVLDKPGVFNRISSLFRRRGFNMDSIAVGHSELHNISRVTIVVDGSTVQVEQVRKQLEKNIDVVKVTDITQRDTITRELALIKVHANPGTRSEIIQIVTIFRAKIVDVSADSLTVEVTGDTPKVDTLYKLLKAFGIKEIARTGCIAMTRGDNASI